MAEAKAKAALQLASEQATNDAAAMREAERRAAEAAKRAADAKRAFDASQAQAEAAGRGVGSGPPGGRNGGNGKPPLPPRGDRDIDRMSGAELEAALAALGIGAPPGGGGGGVGGGVGGIGPADVQHELTRRGLPLGKTREEEMRRLLQAVEKERRAALGPGGGAVIDDASIAKLSPKQLEQALAVRGHARGTNALLLLRTLNPPPAVQPTCMCEGPSSSRLARCAGCR